MKTVNEVIMELQRKAAARELQRIAEAKEQERNDKIALDYLNTAVELVVKAANKCSNGPLGIYMMTTAQEINEIVRIQEKVVDSYEHYD